MNTVVSDAGPLIGLARINRIELPRELFGSLIIPPAVFDEMKVSSTRPGAQAIAEAVKAGWINILPLKKKAAAKGLLSLVDIGEAEAIQLAIEQKAAFLLIDDKKGRKVAKRLGLRIVGIGGLLIAAEQSGLIENVAPVIDDLARAGYRLSSALSQRIIELASG
ncbi:MAG: DUF3368 domain-containing protein [Desulfobacterales bacterium]|nr:DUF3368 domain-containing protein [Desulfobacterales bacterium]